MNFGVAASAPQGAGGDDEDDTPPNASTALTQAFLLLAQASEQQQDFAGAERWLARVDSPQRALEVQARRASLLARQGKMKEARELIRRVPEQSPGDARAKLLAETELLRDRKMCAEAEKVMAQANKAFPDDTDLLYEQAMLDEKLDRVDEMERLLRRVIELKADHQHAYNALGYSLAERKIRLPEARALIQKALELSPGEPSITDSMGWVEYRLGNREEAIRLLRGAYQARPDPEIAAHLGEVLWSDGQAEEARRILREGALARRAERRPARNAGAPARRPVTRRGAMPLPVPVPLRRLGTAASSRRAARRLRDRSAGAARRHGDVLSGRLALRVEPVGSEAPRAVSAAFDLRGDARAGTLGLSTPLGSLLAAGALVAGRGGADDAARDAPLRQPRRADARGARRERADRGLVRLAARPAVARRAERAGRCDAERGAVRIGAGGLSPARLAGRPRPVRRGRDRRDARSAGAGRHGANPPRPVVTR